jgi:hypothetical protein
MILSRLLAEDWLKNRASSPCAIVTCAGMAGA